MAAITGDEHMRRAVMADGTARLVHFASGMAVHRRRRRGHRRACTIPFMRLSGASRYRSAVAWAKH